MREVKITVTRFDPDKDVTPYLQTYNMEVRETNTILNVLMDLAADLDPTIAFRRACRSGICGGCAVKINGKPVLACETLVSDALDGGRSSSSHCHTSGSSRTWWWISTASSTP